jgi:hypothetical protein
MLFVTPERLVDSQFIRDLTGVACARNRAGRD